ncbi:hypothetical protein GH714_038909 [Hevea brasiliensis]|uniref:Uncharacterized protein n=1 Tax=Hevea brasiliensis TaxID=3981 RepID=A0A6A6K9U2_HEVBR|nr:hypothetical protein GH714_038909 [Hevea brasiliensis]
MGQKQQPTADPTVEPKKRRRVGFFNIVSSKEQVDAFESYCIDLVDLNGFFDEDDKGKLEPPIKLGTRVRVRRVIFRNGLDPADKCIKDFVTIISNRVKADILGKDSGGGGKQVIEVSSDYNPEMSFAMFRSGNGKFSSLQMVEN